MFRQVRSCFRETLSLSLWLHILGIMNRALWYISTSSW